jgi:hypothetical protein
MRVPRHRIPQSATGINALARSWRIVADLIRATLGKVAVKSQPAPPVAIWNGEPKCTSIEHDSVYDEP